MWMPFEITDAASAWATQETIKTIVFGTLGLLVGLGLLWRAERFIRDAEPGPEIDDAWRERFLKAEDVERDWRKMR